MNPKSRGMGKNNKIILFLPVQEEIEFREDFFETEYMFRQEGR